MQYQNYKRLSLTRDGRVLRLAFNLPDKMNAVDALMHHELSRVFHDIALDDETDLVVLTGEGRAFSAGGDISWMQSMLGQAGGMASIAPEGRAILNGLLDLPQPIICRLNGDAIGLGATLALCCDIIIAVEQARIADPHVRVGLVAGDGGALIWPMLIGPALAKEFLLTGDMLQASRAAQIGLINRAVPSDALDAEVQSFVTKLARGAQQSIRWTKASVNLHIKQKLGSVFESSLAYEVIASTLPDHAEAVMAFAEGRKPDFSRKTTRPS